MTTDDFENRPPTRNRHARQHGTGGVSGYGPYVPRSLWRAVHAEPEEPVLFGELPECDEEDEDDSTRARDHDWITRWRCT